MLHNGNRLVKGQNAKKCFPNHLTFLKIEHHKTVLVAIQDIYIRNNN